MQPSLKSSARPGASPTACFGSPSASKTPKTSRQIWTGPSARAERSHRGSLLWPSVTPSRVGSAGDCLPVAPAIVVAPGDQLSQGTEVVVGAADAVDQMRDSLFDVEVCVLDVLGSDGYGALYLGRISPDLLAPVVEDGALAGGLLGVPETVPDVGVLGDDAKGYLLASSADE